MNEKVHDSANFWADRIDVITNFAGIKNVVLKRVHCIYHFRKPGVLCPFRSCVRNEAEFRIPEMRRGSIYMVHNFTSILLFWNSLTRNWTNHRTKLTVSTPANINSLITVWTSDFVMDVLAIKYGIKSPSSPLISSSSPSLVFTAKSEYLAAILKQKNKNSHQRRWQISRPKAAWAWVNLATSILLKTKLDLSSLYALYWYYLFKKDAWLSSIEQKIMFNCQKEVKSQTATIYLRFSKSRKEKPQKLTQLSHRSHPRHLVGKRTAQKDEIKHITSDSQVNSYFPYRWSPASLTFNIYFYLLFYP